MRPLVLLDPCLIPVAFLRVVALAERLQVARVVKVVTDRKGYYMVRAQIVAIIDALL